MRLVWQCYSLSSKICQVVQFKNDHRYLMFGISCSQCTFFNQTTWFILVRVQYFLFVTKLAPSVKQLYIFSGKNEFCLKFTYLQNTFVQLAPFWNISQSFSCLLIGLFGINNSCSIFDFSFAYRKFLQGCSYIQFFKLPTSYYTKEQGNPV